MPLRFAVARINISDLSKQLYPYKIIVKKNTEAVVYRDQIRGKVIKEVYLLKNDQLVETFERKGDAMKYLMNLVKTGPVIHPCMNGPVRHGEHTP
jgi:hypothetical protein